MQYWAEVKVSLLVSFEDDGETELESQSFDALLDQINDQGCIMDTDVLRVYADKDEGK